MTQQRSDYPLDYSKGPKTADTTTEKLENLANRAQDVAERAAEQAREYGEKAQEAARNFKPFVEKSMKEKPMGTLAVAAVIGFALGALWKK
jgi:ElaB/YqjD/DUF883 family membrane-anchored ribosome-binding protein